MKKPPRSFSLLVLISFLLCSVFIAPSVAQAGSIWDKIFGHKEETTEPPPEVTLQAPFSNKNQTPPASGDNQFMDMYRVNGESDSKSTISLDQPHRSQDQIAEWASGVVSQAMTIVPTTWDADTQKISENFTPFALDEYKAYVSKTNLVKILSDNRMNLHAITDGPGMVVKEGALSGSYHWLVQIPLMTSFYKDGTSEVDKNSNIQNQNLIAQVQVGRVAPKNNSDIGLTIERWYISGGEK